MDAIQKLQQAISESKPKLKALRDEQWRLKALDQDDEADAIEEKADELEAWIDDAQGELEAAIEQLNAILKDRPKAA